MRTHNPALSGRAFEAAREVDATGQMTVAGTVNKSIILTAIVAAAAFWVWTYATSRVDDLRAPGAANLIAHHVSGYLIVGLIGGLITAIITMFKPTAARFTAIGYAVFEGLLLGGISAIAEVKYHGIAMQAAGLTFGALFTMLFAYKAGLIQVTEKFRSILLMATGGIMLVYLLSFVLRLFGTQMPFIHQGGPIGVGISLVVVTIAALNLLLDFQTIEEGERAGAPSSMEWYGAFGLLVTLVWLYIEFLRLLTKLRAR